MVNKESHDNQRSQCEDKRTCACRVYRNGYVEEKEADDACAGIPYRQVWFCGVFMLTIERRNYGARRLLLALLTLSLLPGL